MTHELLSAACYMARLAGGATERHHCFNGKSERQANKKIQMLKNTREHRGVVNRNQESAMPIERFDVFTPADITITRASYDQSGMTPKNA